MGSCWLSNNAIRTQSMQEDGAGERSGEISTYSSAWDNFSNFRKHQAASGDGLQVSFKWVCPMLDLSSIYQGIKQKFAGYYWQFFCIYFHFIVQIHSIF